MELQQTTLYGTKNNKDGTFIACHIRVTIISDFSGRKWCISIVVRKGNLRGVYANINY